MKEKLHKKSIIVKSDTMIEPYAVMIHSRDAGLAYTTMLTACGLEEMAG